MASAGHSKGTGQEDKTATTDKRETASKGMAEKPRGAAGAGDPEEDVEADYTRPAGEGDVERGRLRGEHKTYGDGGDT